MAIRRGRWRAAMAMALTMAALLAVAVPAAAHGPRVRTVADGFESPLGLAVAKDGTIYVTSAAGVTRLRRGHERLVYEAADSLVAGIDATKKGKVVFTEVQGGGPEEPPTDTTLERLKRAGESRTIASLLEYEERVNPDADQTYGLLDTPQECLDLLPPEAQPYTGIIESNPYAVASYKGGYVVADAAANAIIRVSRSGRKLSTVAVLPPIPQEMTQEVIDGLAEEGLALDPCILGETYHGEGVPTDVEVGRDGHLYVSVLPGFPEAPGAGAVYRIHPRTGAMKQVASGFSGAVDLAIDRKGTIYVAEIFADRISKVRPGGKVSTLVEVPSPGAVEVGPDGKIYATTGVFGPSGSVVRIRR